MFTSRVVLFVICMRTQGGFLVTPECYGQMAHMLSSLANGRVILALEVIIIINVFIRNIHLFIQVTLRYSSWSICACLPALDLHLYINAVQCKCCICLIE